MKIGVIFTGGTIGSAEKGGHIAPREGGAERLLKCISGIEMEDEWIHITDSQCMRENGVLEEVSYEVSSPMMILSENNTGLAIKNMKESIEHVLCQPDLDGVIITHGTDTLVYTAAALGYLFADSEIPIVLVSSNYVLDNPLANGWDNFRYGVAFIAHLLRQNRESACDERIPKGVFVSYQNADRVPRIHRGTALITHQAYSDEVFSVLDNGYGCFEKDGERCRFVKGQCQDAEFSITKSRAQPNLKEPSTWNAPILQIYPYPGMEYPPIPAHIKAILHHSYHSGTICMDKESNAKKFFEEAKRRGIPVFLSSAYGVHESCASHESHRADKVHKSRAEYESTKAFKQMGIITLPPASPVAVYMKLWLLISAEENLAVWMKREIPGDICITV